MGRGVRKTGVLLLVRPDHLEPADVLWEDQVSRLMQTVVDLTGNPAHVFELSRIELSGHLDTEDPILNDWVQANIQLTGLPLPTLLAETPASPSTDPPAASRPADPQAVSPSAGQPAAHRPSALSSRCSTCSGFEVGRRLASE